MPIRPENRARYPADWKAIRDSILLRAEFRCEHRDDHMHRCTAQQYAVGKWVMSDKWRLPVGTEHLQQRVLRWAPEQGNGPCDAAGQGRDWPSLQRWNYADARQFAADLDWAEACGDAPKPIVIVLTIAHLDHTPENCDPSNLMAMCQRHHLAHDAEHHAATRAATRRALANTADMFEEAS